jgi:hypothetical protein
VGVAQTDKLLLLEGLRPWGADRDAGLISARHARRSHQCPVKVATQERAHGRVQGARDVVRPEPDRSRRAGISILRDVERVGRESLGMDDVRGGLVRGGLAANRRDIRSHVRRVTIRRGATPDGFLAQLESLPLENGT